ncbi:hypothetical protein ACSZNB_06145 [Aeromonas hydrophila]
MGINVGSSYPAHIGFCGPIKYLTKYMDLNEVTGIYLRYLLAGVTIKNASVDLQFGPSLKPDMLRVVTVDGRVYQDWQLDDYDETDFVSLCNELSLDFRNVSREKFARTLLLKIAPKSVVPVPAYELDVV